MVTDEGSRMKDELLGRARIYAKCMAPQEDEPPHEDNCCEAGPRLILSLLDYIKELEAERDNLRSEVFMLKRYLSLHQTPYPIQ